MFFCFRTTLVDKRCNYFGLRVYTLRSIRPRFVLFCLFVCFYSFTVHLSDSQPNSFLGSCIGRWRRGGGGGVHLGIIGGGVSPGSPNADPVSHQKCHFWHPFSDLACKIHTPVFRPRLESREVDFWQVFLDWYANKKNFLKSISNSHISLSFLSSFGIKMINIFIHSRSFLENHTRFQTKTGKVYTRFSYGLW